MNPLSWSPDVWTAVGSGATALAFLVAAWVLQLQLTDRRRQDAESVTTWVDDQYRRLDDGGLERSVGVHLKNVGARPVFDTQVVVGYGHLGGRVTRVGPLAVPTQSVLAPGSELSWPVNDLLRSIEVQGRLLAEVSFRDAANRWWIREFDGRVRRWRSRLRRSVRKITDDNVSLDKFGPVSIDNPVSVAAAFWNLLDEPESPERLADLRTLCTPESLAAWGDFSEVARMLDGHGLASFPSYPAPGVAYVKFPESIDSAIVVSGPTLMAAKIMTLQQRDDLDPPGWRVFALGSSIPPERMPPPGVVP